MFLLSVKPSTRKGFKYQATFCLCDKKNACGGSNHKVTHFGAEGYEDYTIHKDKERRDRYRARHEKDLDTKDPTRAGYLSYYLLWGDSTSLQENIKDYKKRFKL